MTLKTPSANLAANRYEYAFDALRALKPSLPSSVVLDIGAGAGILLDVIEHCVNPGLALQNISAALQSKGCLILTTPNPRWSRSRVHSLFYGYPTCFTQRDLDANHHVFTPWPHILEKLLHDAGFEIDDYVTLDGKTGLFDKRRISVSYPARWLLGIGLMAIEQVDRSACGMSYAVIARKVRPPAFTYTQSIPAPCPQ